jgi:Phosphotransferase enzyme family
MPSIAHLEKPIRAITETAHAHGLSIDRHEILQDGSTLVLRLNNSLVVRVVTDLDGPRQGSAWYERENAVAQYLAANDAPVIPMHPDIPPGPYEHLGYTMNFWQYVQRIDTPPDPAEIGENLQLCHQLLAAYQGELPEMAILEESEALIDTLVERETFPAETIELLRERLVGSHEALKPFPRQALHGDCHPNNLMNTTIGLLLTDWEDTFRGPVEWDLASMIWNPLILEKDRGSVDATLNAYSRNGGRYDTEAIQHSLIARAAVMCIWYPLLFPNPNERQQGKLQSRLKWLEKPTGL